ncbi:MAG: PAS domain S-box protein [Ignavibacteriaceae bacterium]|jgi:PAS domain S-box-containing protein|nr:PAS domain S-box protein [Ignavibacteriaceae bacterium]
MINIELVYNLSVIVVFSAISGFLSFRFNNQTSWGKRLHGLLFGITAIIGMSVPFSFTDGIIFDGRLIVISLCAFVFGPLSGSVSAALAIIFRLFIGGEGIIMDALAIFSAFFIGYLFHSYRKINLSTDTSVFIIYSLGLIVNTIAVLLIFILPSKITEQVFHSVAVTIIVFYPLTTVLIGKILFTQKQFLMMMNTLKEKEKLFRTTLYSIGDGVITTDNKGVVVNMNNVAEKLTGWKEAEAKGKLLDNVFNVINEDTGLSIENPVEIVLKKGILVGLANHTVLISKEGTHIPIADSGSPIIDDTGSIIGVVLVFSDQTIERLKEKQLIETTTKFSKLFNSSTDSISLTDLKTGKIVDINLGFEKILGFKKEDIIGKSSYDLKLWADISDRESIWAAIKSDGYIKNFKTKFRRNDDKIISVLLSGEIISFSDNTYIFITIRDITDLISMQDSLQANEERFTSIINSLTDLIIIVDQRGLISHVSPSVKSTLGYNDFEMIGREPMDFVSESYKVIVKDELDKVVRGENLGKPTLFIAICKDKSFCYLETIGINMFDNKAVNGLVLISRDVTERIKSSNLEKENAELFNDLISNNADPMLILNSNGSVLFANKASHQLVDVDQTVNLIGQNITLFMPEEHAQRALETIKQVIISDTPIISEYEIRTSRGLKKWISTASTKITFKGNDSDLVTIRDITERRKIEETLRESEQNYKYLFENNPQPMFVYDKHTLKFLAVNEFTVLKYGYSREEFLSMNLHDIRPEDEYDRLDANIFVSEQKIQQSGYWKHKSKDGKIFFVEIFSHSLSFMGKDARIVLANDISERKKVEDIIRSSEETYRLTAEQTGQVIYDYNLLNGETKWAGAIEHVTGYPYHEFLIYVSKDIYNYVHPDDKDYAVRTRKASLAMGEKFKAEYRFRHKEGVFIYLEESGAIIKDENNSPIRMLGTLSNVTERKLVENQLRNLSRTVEQSPVSIVITDLEGNIEYVNPKFEEVSGYTYKEVIGENPRILSTGTKTKIEYQQMWQTILSGKEWRGEFYNKKKNGELYWESATISPLFNENNEIFRFVAIKEDITQQKKTREELILAKEKAEEMNRLKSYFFANMSHELRTPFVGILGFAEILKENLKDTPEEEFVNQILKSSKRLTDTLNKILNITRIEFDKIDLKLKETDINVLLKNLEAFYSSSAKLNNTEIITVLKEDDLKIITDPKLLEDVLNNLISNAVKFTNNGKITLQAEKLLNDKDNLLIIKIIDTGIGIPVEKQNLVWQEFRQASEGFNRSFEGTGLGLTITKKYVELLSGSISLTSVENEGTTFTITLPLSSAASIPGTEETAKKPESKILPKKRASEKPKILYVEDDVVALQFISIILKAGYEVETAFNANEALQLTAVKQYDILMLDINLGAGMDGIQLLQEIRKTDYYKNIPAVAVTAYAAETDKKEFLSKGFNQYISKPFVQNDLHQILNGILNSGKK